VEDFASSKELAERVVKVEQEKDGVFEAKILNTAEETDQSPNPPLTYYILDYTVDSSRGFKHFKVKTTVSNKHLYVFTVQMNEDRFSELKNSANALIDSFKIL
jgi:hypothetical protein